jgi:hypothetical protein
MIGGHVPLIFDFGTGMVEVTEVFDSIFGDRTAICD